MDESAVSQPEGRRKWKYPIVIALAVCGLILFASLVYAGFSQRTTQLSAYSDRWNDLSKFRNNVEELGFSTSSIVSSPTMLLELEDVSNSLFVAVGIEKAYTSTEARIIYNFVYSGGTAIIADDYGFANSLSKYYFSVKFIGHRLWDQEYDKNPLLVKVDVDPEDDGGFYFDGNILLNDPTALESGQSILASSTNLSWIDTNENTKQDIDELSMPYPIVVRKNMGIGSIVFISDPSIFINDMWDRYDNSRFILALVQHLISSGGTVIFDESRHMGDNVVDNGRQAVYEALVILTTDDQIRWLTAIVTILFLGLLVIAYDDPSDLTHIYNIGKFKLWELQDGDLSTGDTERLRFILLERIRLHSGLSPDEFRELTKAELGVLIGDPVLAAFACDLSRTYAVKEMDELFERIRIWPEQYTIPPEPTVTQLIMQRDENGPPEDRSRPKTWM